MRQAVFEYIETWYNPKRKLSSLDMMSPKQYREFKQKNFHKVSTKLGKSNNRDYCFKYFSGGFSSFNMVSCEDV